MRFLHKLLIFTKLYNLVSVRISQHPFFSCSFHKKFFFGPLFLLGYRKNRVVFSFSGLFYYFLKIKTFFAGTATKSFIVVSSNELTYFLSRSVFSLAEASCIFAPRLGFLTNTSNFQSDNRVSKNQIDSSSSFLLYIGRGGLVNVLKEALVLELPVFAIIGSERFFFDVDYPLFGTQSDMKSAYFYCSFISFIRKFYF